MTFVLLEPKEGIRREHVAQSFEAMVGEWGLPRMLYLDNGAEYSWADMIDGFTALSKVASVDRAVMDLESSPDVADRVRGQKQAVIRSRPYNAKGKPGIEGVFAVLEGGVFSTLQGWVAGDRMKKTHAKGKDPIASPGTASDFLREAGDALDHDHKRPQYGRLPDAPDVPVAAIDRMLEADRGSRPDGADGDIRSGRHEDGSDHRRAGPPPAAICTPVNPATPRSSHADARLLRSAPDDASAGTSRGTATGLSTGSHRPALQAAPAGQARR